MQTSNHAHLQESREGEGIEEDDDDEGEEAIFNPPAKKAKMDNGVVTTKPSTAAITTGAPGMVIILMKVFRMMSDSHAQTGSRKSLTRLAKRHSWTICIASKAAPGACALSSSMLVHTLSLLPASALQKDAPCLLTWWLVIVHDVDEFSLATWHGSAV